MVTKAEVEGLLKAVNEQIEEKGITLHLGNREIYPIMKDPILERKIGRTAMISGNNRELQIYLTGMRDLLYTIPHMTQTYENPNDEEESIQIKSGKIRARTFSLSEREGYLCKEGYIEIKALLNTDESFHNELIIDVCGEEFNNDEEVLTINHLTKILTDKPEKIYDIYIWRDNLEWFKEKGFKSYEGDNPLFPHLYKNSVVDVFKKGKVRIDDVYR